MGSEAPNSENGATRQESTTAEKTEPKSEPDNVVEEKKSRLSNVDIVTKRRLGFEKTRNQLLSEIENKTEGLDCARVESFLTSLGVTPGKYLILDEGNTRLVTN